jgi:autoinducer 2-degrading protein
MVATAVHVKVKPDHVDDFIAASIRNHEASVQEPGNMRFDVLQSRDDPTVFLLYEAYESAELAAGHKKTPHYLEWRETVADWMAEPRKGVPYTALKP